MLTQTSELAIKSLVLLALEGSDAPLSPKPLAARLNCSPSYLAKVFGLLVKSGILKSIRGAHGGVVMGRAPADVTLLDIVEACQGLLIGNYCSGISDHVDPVCNYHRAMREVYVTTTVSLKKWTLADLIENPTPASTEGIACCRMSFEGCEKYLANNPASPESK